MLRLAALFYSNFPESVEMSCLDCLQHRRALKQDLPTNKTANDFKNVYMRSCDNVHEIEN